MTFGNIQQKAGGKETLLLWSTNTALCQTTEKTGCETENKERCVLRGCDYLEARRLCFANKQTVAKHWTRKYWPSQCDMGDYLKRMLWFVSDLCK